MIGVKHAATHFAGLSVRGSAFGKVPVVVPVEATAPVITEGPGFAVSSLIQWCTALLAARLAGGNAWSRVCCFLLSTDTGQEGFDGTQGQSCGFRYC